MLRSIIAAATLGVLVFLAATNTSAQTDTVSTQPFTQSTRQLGTRASRSPGSPESGLDDAILHIQVQETDGHGAPDAAVLVLPRGRAGRMLIRRTNGIGRVTVRVPGSSYLIRARGRGGNHGSVHTGVSAGADTSVIVQLHGALFRGYYGWGWNHGLGLRFHHNLALRRRIARAIRARRAAAAQRRKNVP